MGTTSTILLVTSLLILGAVGNHAVRDVSPSSRGSTFLQEAVKNLVNYTAIEVEARLDKDDIANTVAAIAYQKVTAKIGKCRVEACTMPYEYVQLIHTQDIAMIIKV